MPQTYNTAVLYTGNGATTTFSIPFSYALASDVKASLNGIDTPLFSVSGSLISFFSAPATAVRVRVYRQSGLIGRRVDYTDGAVLSELDLDKDSIQSYNMSQEAFDQAQAIAAGYSDVGLAVDAAVAARDTAIAQANNAGLFSTAAINANSAAQAASTAAINANSTAQTAATAANNSNTTAQAAATSASTSAVNATNSAQSASLSANSLTGAVAAVNSAIATGGGFVSVFTPNGTGAVARSAVTRLKETVHLKDFGAVGDLVTDDTAAVQAFFNHCALSGATGRIQAGQYLIKSMITITVGTQGFTIDGPGANSATFYGAATFVGATPVIKVLGSSGNIGWRLGGFGIRPITGCVATIGIQFGAATGSAAVLQGYQYSTVYDLFVSDFTNGIHVSHCRMIHFKECAVWNTGITTQNSCLRISQSGGGFTGDLMFTMCQFVATRNNTNRCLLISTTGPFNISNGDNSLAGIKFNACLFYSGVECVRMDSINGSLLADIWFYGGCQMDQLTTNVIKANATGAGSAIDDIHIQDVFMNAASSQTVSFTADTSGNIRNVWIKDCQIYNAQAEAIYFNATTGGTMRNLRITGNTIQDNGINGSSISFYGAIDGINADGNSCVVGPNILSPYYLLLFTAGNTSIAASGNRTAGVARVAGILDNSGNVYKNITDNPGYNPRPPVTITVTASPFVYTNTSGAPELVQISGGTVTNLNIGVIGIPFTSPMYVPVGSGNTLNVTYSALPLMRSFGI